MNRGNFIKGLIALCAAPSIVKGIGVEKTMHVGMDYNIQSSYTKIGCWFKVSKKMIKNKKLFKKVCYEKIKEAKIDTRKPFDCKVGFSDVDFISDLQTVVISQRVYN